jgi:ornithine--oxo-acid transaminase
MIAGEQHERSTRSQSYIDLEDAFGAHNYDALNVVLERGEGVWVWDVEGRKYLDCLAAYSALNLGHRHPAVLQALFDQASRITLTSRAFRNDQLPLLYCTLHALTGMHMALPMNSGAEAVETAIKAARKWGYTFKGIPEDQAEIIVCSGNFHGRTLGIISFSTEPQYRRGFGPFVPGFKIIPFGDVCALEQAITPNTCGFLVEPIQGEAGIIIPPPEFLKRASEVCRNNRVLLIADEVQSGLGRTGKLFAYTHSGITPDVLILGKTLGGGCYPISAVLASREVLGVFQPGDHGSTFGGNPLGCAVARAALEAIQVEKLAERSAELGDYFLAQLRLLTNSRIREIRGKGLWIGVEMKDAARPYCDALMREGVLCKDTHRNVIRMAPPLIITRDEIDWLLTRIRRVLNRPPE